MPTEHGIDLHRRYETIFASLDGPFALVDLDAMWWNARDLLRRARAKPIRVASKSIRCRSLLAAIRDRSPRFRGFLTFTLAETLFLAEGGFTNLMLGYPTTDRAGLARLAELAARAPETAPVLMVDSTAHLDLIDSAAGRGHAPLRVCLDIDVGFWPFGGRLKIGPKRSPVRTPAAAAALAREVVSRPGFELAGLMGYEGHIAGVGDRPLGRPLHGPVIRAMQRMSAAEIRDRRAAVVAAVREVSDVGIVNGGGTGSLETTAGEPAITEVTAGSGFYGPGLFDDYGAFSLRPAAMFAAPVVRRPGSRVATVAGGGYVASGAPGRDRLPRPHLPGGLALDPLEGAGEVQTPVRGEAADRLAVGDNVYFRHAKAGELCEHFDRLHLVEGDRIVDEVPTYRGEGRTFL